MIFFNHLQHGFRGEQSCLNQLINILIWATSLLERGKTTNFIYLYPAQAFHKVGTGVPLVNLNRLASRESLGDDLCASSLTSSRPSLWMGGSHLPVLLFFV